MHDTGAMCIGERTCEVGQNANDLRDGQRTVMREPGTKTLAGDVRHREVQQSSPDFTGREERDDVRMLQPRREPDLPLEPLGGKGLGEL